MKVLVTGGCGFIGCNTALSLHQKGHDVAILDDLSRSGASRNKDFLQEAGEFEFAEIDVRDAQKVEKLIKDNAYDALIHLAAQVAVTTSVDDPRIDFEINALGTFNILEAVRKHSPNTVLLNASTNKVYGRMEDAKVEENQTRYYLPDFPMGISEAQPLDFHSPYGCSKGVADQYILDYSRIFDLRTVTFRQSCIYGYRQFGIEDQGWVAWFMIALSLRKKITIFGTGKQVRDVLFIDDLVDLYTKAIENIEQVSGMAFNVGGGPENTVSLLEFLEKLESISGRTVEPLMGDWRPGDQPVYVSDIRKAEKILGWKPKVDVSEGMNELYGWVAENSGLFKSLMV